MTIRRLPQVGEAVTVLYLGGPMEAVIEHVADDMRELDVRTSDGSSAHFRLNHATARFWGTGDAAGARLVFRLPDHEQRPAQ